MVKNQSIIIAIVPINCQLIAIIIGGAKFKIFVTIKDFNTIQKKYEATRSY